MDDLGKFFGFSTQGCRLGDTAPDKIWYADDLCLLASSIHAIQKLIDISTNYMNSHNTNFNSKKTVCMVFAA